MHAHENILRDASVEADDRRLHAKLDKLFPNMNPVDEVVPALSCLTGCNPLNGKLLWRCRSLPLVIVLLLVGCARSDALWTVTHDLCMNNYHYRRDPSPCQQVYLPQDSTQGYSIIQNPRHKLHFILVPTVAISGIESITLSRRGGPDYFGYAWLMRYRLMAAYGAEVPEDRLGMALNSAYGRSQNQLHIHLTCLREDVYRQLQAERPFINNDWRPLPDRLLNHTYYARRVMQPTAMGIYPVSSVARHFHLSSPQLAESGVALIPATFSGEKGFILLTTRRGWDKGNRASVESLLDKRCAILSASPADVSAE